jgi:hypothetical protein
MLELHLVDESLPSAQLEFHLSGLLPPALTEILVTATKRKMWLLPKYFHITSREKISSSTSFPCYAFEGSSQCTKNN